MDRREVRVDLARYDWIVVNSSAGKDSQCMLDYIVERCKTECIPLDRVVVVHADLEEEEWPGTKELAARQATLYGLRFEVVKRKQGGILQHVRDRHAKLVRDGKNVPPWMSSVNRWCTADHKRGQVATLFTKLTEETRQRKGTPPWPSPTNRWCTSHHKADQVSQLFTRLTQEGRQRNGREYRVRILNCMGMRAGESCAREKLLPFKLDRRNTNGRRLVHIWLPIHGWTVEQVWERVRASGVPHHYAYDLGMPRLSCVFCIFAPRNALLLAGKYNPALLDKYVQVEQETGFSFRKELPLLGIRDALDRGEEPGNVKTWEM